MTLSPPGGGVRYNHGVSGILWSKRLPFLFDHEEGVAPWREAISLDCRGDWVRVRIRKASRSRSANRALRPLSSRSLSADGEADCCCCDRCRLRISIRSSTEACRSRWKSRKREVLLRSRLGALLSSWSFHSPATARGGASCDWPSTPSAEPFSPCGRRSRRLVAHC
jgi:hypothetical protein